MELWLKNEEKRNCQKLVSECMYCKLLKQNKKKKLSTQGKMRVGIAGDRIIRHINYYHHYWIGHVDGTFNVGQ